MIKLNRTTEYGLIALRYMSSKANQTPQTSPRNCVTAVISAREIADYHQIPFEILAKTLQRLKDGQFIQSAHGAKGGYTLSCSLDKVTMTLFLDKMEGTQSVVSCANGSHEHLSACEYDGRCELKSMMGEFNSRIRDFLSGITLSEFMGDRPGRFSQSNESPAVDVPAEGQNIAALSAAAVR